MGTRLTLRIDERLSAALRARAAVQGKSMSAVAREILSEALAEGPFRARAGHLRGQLRLRPASSDLWRKDLRERNWRP